MKELQYFAIKVIIIGLSIIVSFLVTEGLRLMTHRMTSFENAAITAIITFSINSWSNVISRKQPNDPKLSHGHREPTSETKGTDEKSNP
jgi:hypothetical protein